MKHLILLFVIVFCSCSLLIKDEPYDPGVPTTPITKNIPFTCDGSDFVKMLDSKITGYNGPYMLMDNDLIYSLDSNKLTLFDCDSLKIIKSQLIDVKKIYYLEGYAGLKNNNFWLIYTTFDSKTTLFLSLIDSSGKAIRTFNFESEFLYADGVKISPTSRNGCVIGCFNNNIHYIYNFDVNGNIIWKKTYYRDFNNINLYSVFSKIIELKTKEFIYCTVIQEVLNGQNTVKTKITKLDKDGNLIWEKQLTTPMQTIENLIEQSDNSYLMSGHIGSFSNSNLFKVDSTGNISWKLDFTNNDYVKIMVTREGRIIAGYKVNENGGDIGLSKISNDGKIEWRKTFGGTGNEDVNYMCELKSGGYYLIGTTNNLTGKWEKALKTEPRIPYDKYYEYYKGFILSDYFIKTDNQGNSCNP